MNIKLVITDIDGVWTDGSMYYTENGDEMKRFNTIDSAGIIYLRILNIPLAIITGENTQMVARRAKKLNITHLFQGIKKKLAVAQQLCDELGVTLDEVAYIGDDIGDIVLLRKVGFSAAPANAADYVKSEVDLVLKTKGGSGAFREFVEHILKENNLLESTIEQYLETTV